METETEIAEENAAWKAIRSAQVELWAECKAKHEAWNIFLARWEAAKAAKAMLEKAETEEDR